MIMIRMTMKLTSTKTPSPLIQTIPPWHVVDVQFLNKHKLNEQIATQ
jgi:hypothetical protein